MRIAMWSGPRNLSTAMMYSFASRADTVVIDEPFYAAYLQATGLQHPMREEILASQATNPDAVVRDLLAPIPEHSPVFYQKHMAQHMIDVVPRDWMASVRNVFLIRHPARVVSSFSVKYENPTVTDLGFAQQRSLFEEVSASDDPPLVIDSTDLRENPEGMLRCLCDTLGLAWDISMLSWKAGGHPSDGVWAPHWYDAVHRSTGFATAEGPLPSLTSEEMALVDQVMPDYEHLAAEKMRPVPLV